MEVEINSFEDLVELIQENKGDNKSIIIIPKSWEKDDDGIVKSIKLQVKTLGFRDYLARL